MRVISWNGSITPDAGVIGKTMRDEGLAVSAHPYPPDHLAIPSTAKTEESLWVVRGSLELENDGTKTALKAGDRAIIPQGARYTFTVSDPTGVFFLLGKRV